MRTKRISLIAVAAASMMALAGCSAAAAPDAAPIPVATFAAGTTMERLASAGSITIGTKFDQPLFGLIGPTGTPVGFDVEIGKKIAASLGIPESGIKWTETVSANRELFIENGTVDIVVATYTINDKRKERISFAGPYYSAGQSILVKADNTSINTEADLAGKPVCSVTGSTPAAKLAEIGAVPLLTDTYTNCLEPLRSGAAVAVSTDNVILAGLAAQNEGEFKVVGDPFTQEPYGIGLGKTDTAFRTHINDMLEAAYADGSYEAAWTATAGTVLPFVTPPAVNRYP